MDHLFFYDARDGRAAIGKIAGPFVETARYDPGHLAPGWTHVCRLESTLFFYSGVTGTAAWGTVSDAGFAGTGSGGGFSPGWTHVIAAPQMYVDVPRYFLFYNAVRGSAALGRVDSGSFHTDYTYEPGALSRGWTHVAPTPVGVFFYSAASGASALYGVGRGLWINRSYPPGSFSNDWTHVIARRNPQEFGDYEVLLYRAETGEAVRADDKVRGGRLEVLLEFLGGAGLSRGWTHAAGGAGLFFYDRHTGRAAILGGDSYGPGEFRRGWTHVVGEASSGLMLRWGTMQGFCWPPSGAPGDTIAFRASTAASAYTVSFVRFENAESVTAADVNNGRELVEETIRGPVSHAGLLQNTQLDPASGCGSWATGFTLTVPGRWRSGVYAAKCRDALGGVFYIPFAVKPAPIRTRRLAALVNVNTWNAYNPWGGYSRYEVAGDADLSFLRPNFYHPNLSYSADHWDELGSYHYHSQHLLRGELWVLNWLAEAGYQVDVYTDLDFHAGIDGLDGYDALILNTHPEYWSVTMYDNLKSYLDGGGRLLYLGGNGIYDSVDLSDDLTTMTVYGPQNARTAKFRQIGRPEADLLGVAYTDNVDERAPYAVASPGHSLLDGIRLYGPRPIDSRALAEGDLIGREGWSMHFGAATLADGAASGFECDQSGGHPVEVIAKGTNAGESYRAEMVLYRYGGDGFVFSAGSIAFGGSLAIDPILQKIVNNALDACLAAGRARRILGLPAGSVKP